MFPSSLSTYPLSTNKIGRNPSLLDLFLNFGWNHGRSVNQNISISRYSLWFLKLCNIFSKSGTIYRNVLLKLETVGSLRILC